MSDGESVIDGRLWCEDIALSGTGILSPVDEKSVSIEFLVTEKRNWTRSPNRPQKGTGQKKITFTIFWQLKRNLTMAAPAMLGVQ